MRDGGRGGGEREYEKGEPLAKRPDSLRRAVALLAILAQDKWKRSWAGTLEEPFWVGTTCPFWNIPSPSR
jgi:hypothetical protein